MTPHRAPLYRAGFSTQKVPRPMATIVITDALLRSLKVEQRTDFWDAKTPGFGVRVGAHTKMFIAKVENRRHTIGIYPDISLADARRKALAIKAKVHEQPGSEVTFQEAYETFKIAHIAFKSARTQYDYTRVLEKFYLPKVGKLPLSRVTNAHIAKITDPWLDRPVEYAHLLAVARTFLRWCVRPPRQYIPHSPLEGLQLPRHKARDRVLTDDELVRVWHAANELGYPFGSIVKLCILLGQRRSQTAAIAQSWIDRNKRIINFPREAMKSSRPHVVPYSDPTAAIIGEIRATDSLLFPARGHRDHPFNGWSVCTNHLYKRVGEIPHFVLHDLRRTFASGLQRLGVRLEVTESLLGHTSGSLGGIRAIYQRYDYANEKREAITLWEKHVASLLAADCNQISTRAA
jgi:integrase